MNIIYLIHAHTRPSQVKKLVEVLNGENTFFVLNIDLKSDKSLFPVGSNIFFVEDRNKVFWAGFSQVQQTINSLKYIRNNFTNYSHVVMLSEYCYPIKKAIKIKEYLSNHSRNTFCLAYEASYSSSYKSALINLNRSNISDRIKYVRGKRDFKFKLFKLVNHVKALRRIKCKRSGVIRNINMRLYAGSNWIMFNEVAVNYILQWLDSEIGVKFYSLFSKSFAPDETFFQTILMNSELKSSIISNHHRYIDWTDKKEWPKIFRIHDFDKLKSRSKKNSFFARKFIYDEDSEIIIKIDRDLLGITNGSNK